MTDDTRAKRDQIIEGIAQIIDHPSVYMGGPSRNSLRIAEIVVKEFPAILDATPAQPMNEGDLCQFCHDAGASSCACLSGQPSASPTGNTALVEALEEAKIWHESQDKAISKQPPSNSGEWMRLQHQEQIEAIDAALSQHAAPQPTPEVEALVEWWKSQLPKVSEFPAPLFAEKIEQTISALARGSVAEKGER